MPKAKLVGAKLALDAAPVPVRLTVWGLPVALSVTVIVPGWLPVAVGVKVTLMEQLAPAAGKRRRCWSGRTARWRRCW